MIIETKIKQWTFTTERLYNEQGKLGWRLNYIENLDHYFQKNTKKRDIIWKYKVVTIEREYDKFNNEYREYPIEETVNEYGKLGWEICTMRYLVKTKKCEIIFIRKSRYRPIKGLYKPN